MKRITRSALVPFSAKQIYNLVDDLEKYPEFVPYCKKVTIINRKDQSVSAELEIAKGSIAKSFSTENHLVPFNQINMSLLNGPFKSLDGCWRFNALSDDACKVELDLAFEFSNKLTSFAFSKLFNELAEKMINAFTERAHQVYG